jgi:DNA-directed RNA polymerase specialized sigma24 family protein
MFKRAREAGLRPRYLLLSEILSERILARSRRAVLRMGIYPSLMGNLGDASDELAQYFWKRLLEPHNLTYAESRFGSLFKFSEIMFLRELTAKKRTQQVPLTNDTPDFEDDVESEFLDSLETADELTPERIVASTQAILGLTSVLSQAELSAITMLRVKGMSVAEVAATMGVTTRTINTYKNAALKKLAHARKEHSL